MANWAITNYVIEGPKEDLQKIYDAIKVHDVENGSSEDWEGNILNALGIDWERHNVERQDDGKIECSGLYMRGFIYDEPELDLNKEVLSFMCEEAWGLTDFRIPLREHFPEITVYWQVEEEGCDVFATNDEEGKYFPERYYIDVYIKDEDNQDCFFDDSEYFSDKEEALMWLSEKTNGKVKSKEDIAKFNEEHETGEQFISWHEYTVEED